MIEEGEEDSGLTKVDREADEPADPDQPAPPAEPDDPELPEELDPHPEPDEPVEPDQLKEIDLSETADEPEGDDESEEGNEPEESGESGESDESEGGEDPDDLDEPTYGPPPDPDDGGLFDAEGPPGDEEMPLTAHIEEMMLRLAAVLVIAGAVTAIAFPFAQEPITYIWFSILPGEEIARPRVYGPLELKLTELKFSSLAGLIAAMPMAVYQTYRFMRPGLYPHERRYYLAAIPTSLILAFIGVAFAFFLILPAIFTYFMYYSQDAGEIAFGLAETFNLIIIMKAFMAIAFQIPLMMMLAIMMGVTTRRWLQNRRLYFWAAFLGLAFIFNPDPTGMAPIMVASTMVGLFEGTLLLLRWTGN